MSENFYIVTSSDEQCPRRSINEQCLTLEQFANHEYNFSASFSRPGEMILELQPGIHLLSGRISTSCIKSFTMNSLDATVPCKKQRFTLSFTRVQSIEISGISFISCGGIEIFDVGRLTIDRSNFIDHYLPWSVDSVRNATITTTSFI